MAHTNLSYKNQQIVNNSALAAAGLGIPGIFLPGVDMVGVSAVWVKMMVDLAKESGHEVNLEFAGKVMSSVLAGAGLYMGGSKLLTTLLTFTGVGAVPAAGLNAIFNWIYTLRLGKLLATQFSKPGFTPAMLMASAKGFTGLVFALPTLGEVGDAWHAVGHLLNS